ncbi:class I ribonucleotide reductase maintenance protein YfaE [Candidatus Gillettellia adelgis]
MFTIKLQTTGQYFTCQNSASYLLEILELHWIKVEYQCRSGYCGICRLKLVKGDVAYYQSPLALINDGEILPCCCMLTTNIELGI